MMGSGQRALHQGRDLQWRWGCLDSTASALGRLHLKCPGQCWVPTVKKDEFRHTGEEGESLSTMHWQPAPALGWRLCRELRASRAAAVQGGKAALTLPSQ